MGVDHMEKEEGAGYGGVEMPFTLIYFGSQTPSVCVFRQRWSRFKHPFDQAANLVTAT